MPATGGVVPNGRLVDSRTLPRRTTPVLRLVAALAAAAAVAGCSEPRLQVELPASWHEINGDGSITLRPDGTGDVENFPTPAEGPCSLATAAPYTGPIEWRAVADGRLVIPFEHGEVLMGADTQVLSLNWDKLVLPFCGEGDVDEYVVFSGGPRSG